MVDGGGGGGGKFAFVDSLQIKSMANLKTGGRLYS